MNSKILESVIADYLAREQLGLQRYGTTVDRTDLSAADWLKHLREELMDATLYAAALEAQAKRTERQAYEAECYRWICQQFNDMKTSTSERLMECLDLEGQAYEDLDELISRKLCKGKSLTDLRVELDFEKSLGTEVNDVNEKVGKPSWDVTRYMK